MSLLWLALGLVASASPLPVVIVPGTGSSQLQARINKSSVVEDICDKTSDWFRLYVQAGEMLLKTPCWVDNIRLIYDEATDVLSNNHGVEVRVPFFGETRGVEDLDETLPFHLTDVFGTIVRKLISHGYERNLTIRAAPYDWRFAASSPEGQKYLANLKQLIEETSQANQAKVNLMSHSMGGLQVLQFLRQQSQAWKDMYIEQWISISTTFGGTVKTMGVFASGDSQYVPMSLTQARTFERSHETNYWMLPEPHLFQDQVLLSTPKRNYTAQNFDAFFSDLNFSTGQRMVKRVSHIRGPEALGPPGVTVACLHSHGVKTPERFVFDSEDFDNTQPQVIMGDGDGQVNTMSLRLCNTWSQSQPVQILSFEGVEHRAMLSNSDVIDAVLTRLGIMSEVLV